MDAISENVKNLRTGRLQRNLLQNRSASRTMSTLRLYYKHFSFVFSSPAAMSVLQALSEGTVKTVDDPKVSRFLQSIDTLRKQQKPCKAMERKGIHTRTHI